MLQEQRKAPEREKCRKGIFPEIILLGRGVNNVMTVIGRWGAISYIRDTYIRDGPSDGRLFSIEKVTDCCT